MKPKLPTAAHLLPYIEQIDANRIYSNHGPLITLLEENYADIFGVSQSQVVAVGNATLALEGALRQSNVNNWLLPAFTFPATGQAALNACKKIIFCDVDHVSMEVNINNIAPKESSFYGLLPVLPFGEEAVFSKWSCFDEVVIDAAASLGNLQNLSALPRNWSIIYSLHATKVFPAGEGALAVFGSIERAERMRAWINFGFWGSRISQIQSTNAKMSEIHAAYALASLDMRFKEISDWRKVRNFVVNSHLGITFGTSKRYDSVNPYWLIKLPQYINHQNFCTLLEECGIGSRPWWGFLPDMPPFLSCATLSALNVSRALSTSIIGLPFYRDLTKTNIDYISSVVEKQVSLS